jgi:uncharacterized protein YwqG
MESSRANFFGGVPKSARSGQSIYKQKTTRYRMPFRSEIQFIPAAAPITESVTKFGGQPVWHSMPQWPLSRATGNPMRFICQVVIDDKLFPNSTGRMAYIFITDEENYVDGTWEPNGGENAVIIQPSPLPVSVLTSPQITGPTLYDMVEIPGKDRLVPVEREYATAMTVGEEPAYQSEDVRSSWSDEDNEKYSGVLGGNKVGGAPIFLQGDEFPDDGEWRLLLQLDSVNVPFSVNFGDAGIAYAFIDPAGRTGKLLWQCS